MKKSNNSLTKESPEATNISFIFEIIAETTLVLFSRLKGWSELRSCSPMQPKEGSTNEISDRQ
jgi:hypothetical protein